MGEGLPSNFGLIIVPTYGEAASLPRFLDRLGTAAPPAHVLIVDDDSGDGTPDIITSHPQYGSAIHLLARPSKLGLGTAYIEGFRWALARDYSWVCEMDADLSHSPGELGKLLSRLNQGAELVLGSRYLNGVRVLNWPVERLLISLFAAAYVRACTGMPFTDPTGGFRIYRRELLERLNLDAILSNGYAFQIEMLFEAWKSGTSIVEVPITFRDRVNGTSKMSRAIALEAAWRTASLCLRRWGRREVLTNSV